MLINDAWLEFSSDDDHPINVIARVAFFAGVQATMHIIQDSEIRENLGGPLEVKKALEAEIELEAARLEQAIIGGLH